MTIPWRVIGSSVIGISHQERSIPCQDAYVHTCTPDGHVLLVVADGAGSAKRSQDGSSLAVRTALDVLSHALTVQHPSHRDAWQQVVQQAFSSARNALDAYATTENIPLYDVSTTLTCVVATNKMLVTGQVGDGFVVAETPDGILHTAIAPQRGEYANETIFLTHPNLAQHVTINIEPLSVLSLVVSTDGMLRLAMQLPDYTPSPRFFCPLLDFLAEATDETEAHHALTTLLASERVNDRTDDDKTLVIARRLVCLLRG